MRLFKSDLYRNFAVGFAVGAAIAVLHVAPQMSDGLVSQAHAATIEAPVT